VNNFKFWVLCGFGMILLSENILAEDITRQRARELMQECQSERKRNIAPLKEQAINNCINNQNRGKDTCEQYYRNFGERTEGGRQTGLFWGLPICEKAFEAEKYFNMNPGKETYRLP